MVKTNNSSSLSRLFSFMVMLVTVLQTAITAMPLEDKTVISAVLLFLTIALTSVKQIVSVEVNSKQSRWAIGILLAVAIAGGINEAGLIEVFKFKDASTSQWIRVGLTFLVATLDEAAKTFFPSEESKIIEQAKQELKTDQKIERLKAD